jgi:magnesium-transporting ATPase (P-type)
MIIETDMPNTDTFPQEVVKEIEARGAKPRARWKFLMSRGVMWFLAIASIVIGGFAFAVAEFVFFDNDGIMKVQGSSIQDIAESIPFVWLALVGVFSSSASLSLRRTRRGYKYATATLVALVVALSVVLGLFLNYFDFGQRVHEYLIHQITLQALFNPATDGIN